VPAAVLKRTVASAVVLAALVAGCSDGGGDGGAPASRTSVPTAAELERQGGAGTVFVDGRGAFEQPMPGMESAERRTFAVGNSLFNQNWVTAPSSTEGRDGLGPLLNAQSCSSCHFKDGRSRPPENADDPERGLLVRISVDGSDGEPEPHPAYGSQFQDRSVRAIAPEGSVVITTTERTGTYDDGTGWSLAVPSYELLNADGQPIEDVMISPRVAPAMMGVGLLEAIPDADLVAAADPDDADGDGISGTVRMVTDPETGADVIGRFGWKSGAASVKAQSADAFANDIGITSSTNPDQPCTAVQTACLAQPSGGDPEIDDEKLDQVTFYARTLAVPARRGVTDRSVSTGSALFVDLGCSSCHTPEQRTGASEIVPLDQQVIRPYTDLLLHDMGPDLADDRPDGTATGREWRTPPLWGIGLVETVNRHTRFLHDGRARNLEEAVLWHGGEAEPARERFEALTARQRDDLLTFLESL
jgi:CxxC motif-containing protein (DUF1111 family)